MSVFIKFNLSTFTYSISVLFVLSLNKKFTYISAFTVPYKFDCNFTLQASFNFTIYGPKLLASCLCIYK